MSVIDKSGVSEAQCNAARQEKAVWISMVIDIATFVPCAVVAVLSGSMLLLSDTSDYLRSFAANIVTLRILRGIRRGEVHDYDYGPGKLERIGSLFGALCFIAGLLALAGFSLHKLLHPAPLDTSLALMGMLIQVASVVVNGWLWFHYKRLANETRTPLIDMHWRHQRTMCLSSIAVFAALGLTQVFKGHDWALYIDPVCALVYVVYAVGSYAPVINECLHDLMDKTLDEEMQIRVLRHLATHYLGYEAFYGVRSRRSGDRIFIEISLGFDPDKRVGEAVDTIFQLRKDIETDIPKSDVSIVLRPLEKPDITAEEKTSIQILPLSPATLEEAVSLITSTFKVRDDELPREELEESLWPGKHTAALAKIGISDPRYWVAFHKHKVIGVAGLAYHPEDRHEAIWGGWAVYAEGSREGLSRARFLMLRKLAIEAAGSKRKFFRLDTSTDPVSRAANHFYDRVGLNIYKTEERPGEYTILYRQMELDKILDLFERKKHSEKPAKKGAGDV